MQWQARPPHRGLLLVISLALVIGLASCGGNSGGGNSASTGTPGNASDAQVVRSDDGSAELTVPTGALPDGVKLSDIKVSKLSSADASVTSITGDAPIAIYRLLPDGTQFKKPVSINVTTPADGGVILGAVLLGSGKEAPLLLDSDTILDEAGKTSVTVTIPHFSTLVVYLRARITLQLPDRVGVGESFAAKVDLSYVVIFGSFTRSTERVLGADFTGTNVKPGEIKDAPPRTSIGLTFSASGTFSCVRAGAATVTWHAFLDDTVDLAPLLQGLFVDHHKLSVTGKVACANRPPKVTQLKATLSAPITTYTVTASDPDGDPLTYEWKMAGELCGTPQVPWTQAGQTVKWSHSDQSPDRCEHKGTNHAVITSVTVSDGKGGSVQCIILGTETQTIDNPDCK